MERKETINIIETREQERNQIQQTSDPIQFYGSTDFQYSHTQRVHFFLDSDDSQVSQDVPGGGEPLEVEASQSSSTSSEQQQLLHKIFDIFLEILSLAFTICDMSFVGILVYRHYMGDEDPLQAWAMLLPIFLSTFGVQLFFEKYPPKYHWWNELLNVPLFGPVFCTGELLYAKCTGGSAETHRIEAESIKLKQYESMFRAYPEGVVMLSVLFINRTVEVEGSFIQNCGQLLIKKPFKLIHTLSTGMMEILCVIFGVLCLAESHWYGIVSDFYRIHHRGRPTPSNHEDRSRPHSLRNWQKSLLFTHAVAAIGLRIYCEGLLRATIYFQLNPEDTTNKKEGRRRTIRHTFTEILLIVFFGEMMLRSLLHLLSQLFRELCSLSCYKWLLNPFYSPQYHRSARRGGFYYRVETTLVDGLDEEDEEEGGGAHVGIHGAVKHGLLTTLSPLQFQSKYLPTLIWFYVENLIFILIWFVGDREGGAEEEATAVFLMFDKQLLAAAMGLFIVALALQGAVSYLTIPETSVCVVRIRRVPHRYVSVASVSSTAATLN